MSGTCTSSKGVARAVLLAIAGIALTGVAPLAAAQEVIPDFYKGPGLDPNRSYVNQSFSEHIDPFNGSLGLHYVDIRVPGNGGFDLEVARSYNSNSVDETSPVSYFGSAGVGWTMHFGRVLYKFANGLCNQASYPDTSKDPVLELPDGSRQILALSAVAGASFITKQWWRGECLSNGIAIHSPSGVRYDMTQAVKVPNGTATAFDGYYTTRITDRNGNYATLTYTGAASPEVSSITTNDGRRIDFSYFAAASGDLTRRIASITSRDGAGDRTFRYDYVAVPTYGGYQLKTVTRPDGTQWSYDYNSNLNQTRPGGFQLVGVTFPERGTITYSYGSSASDYVYFDSLHQAARSTVVKSKQTQDGGYWSFQYSPRSNDYDTTTVNTPSGTVTYRHMGPNFARSGQMWMVGLLMSRQVGGDQSEQYNWTPLVVSQQDFSRPGAWAVTVDATLNAAVLSSKTIYRDGAAHSTSYSGYDAYGNPGTVYETGPGGGTRSTSLSYFRNTSNWVVNQLKDQTVSGGVQITRTIDSIGNVIATTRDGVQTSTPRCSTGDVSQATFPRGLTHYYPCGSYKRGIAQNETQPEGINLSRNVSDSGNVVSETNGRGYTTGYGYDGLNRLSSIAPARGSSTTISHSATSKSATRGALTETTQYDGFGRPTSITIGGITRAYGYDSLGRLTFASNPGDSSRGDRYSYDILNRVRRVDHADGNYRTIGFGPGSKTVSDERSYATTYQFRAYGNPGEQYLMAVAAPDSTANLSMVRDVKDLVRQITQAGFTRSYDFDSRGFLYRVTNPETGVTSYGRDDANNMTSRTVGSSGQTTYQYDGQNRMYYAAYPGSTPSVSKSYTKTNRIESVTTSVATRRYGYDENDNLTSESLTVDGYALSLAYGYNGNDQLAWLQYPRSLRTIQLSPDALGRPSQVSGFASSVGYWPSGQISQISYTNGTTSTYGQNSRLWPNYFQTTKGSNTYVSSSYGYDGMGLTSISDAVDSGYNRSVGYDALDRVRSVSGPWGSGTISYDGLGNLRSQTFGAYSLTYGYDGSNRLASVSGARSGYFTYDDYGDVRSAPGKTFQYDGAPNMICANCADTGARVDYQYDGLNQRVSSSKGGIKTYEFYDFNGNLLSEFTPAISNRLAENIYLGGRRIATIGPAPSSVSLPARTSTALAGQAVTLVATVSGANPTGTVKFYDSSTLIATAAVASGQASTTTSFSGLGPHTIRVEYGGDGANLGSSFTATINILASTTITGPAGGPALTAVEGKPTTLAATINGVLATGTVSFYDGSRLLGAATLSGGTGSISATLTSPGPHTITIVYSGDSQNAGSSATVTLTVTISPGKLVPILQLLLD